MSGAKQTPTKPVVLIAEDDPEVMRMLVRVVGAVAEVVACRDGMEAYQHLRSGAPLPRLLVTDIMMPRLDGLALVTRMQTDTRLAQIPVIFLTAKGAPRDVIVGINSGARFYVTKPFKQEDLLAKVTKVLGS